MPRLRNASWSSSNVRGPVVGSMAAMACRMPQARCPSSTLLAMAWDRVGRAAQAAYVASVAGLVALVTIALFFSIGQPWGTLNDIALLVMTLAIAPMMLGSYELGGVTPLWPARLSLAGGIGGVVVWSAIQVAMIVGVVSFDYNNPATGAYAVEDFALIVIGAWLTGAPPLAGSWLPLRLKALGGLAGLGLVLTGLGLLVGSVNSPLVYLGGLGYPGPFSHSAHLPGRVVTSSASSCA